MSYFYISQTELVNHNFGIVSWNKEIWTQLCLKFINICKQPHTKYVYELFQYHDLFMLINKMNNEIKYYNQILDDSIFSKNGIYHQIKQTKINYETFPIINEYDNQYLCNEYIYEIDKCNVIFRDEYNININKNAYYIIIGNLKKYDEHQIQKIIKIIYKNLDK